MGSRVEVEHPMDEEEILTVDEALRQGALRTIKDPWQQSQLEIVMALRVKNCLRMNLLRIAAIWMTLQRFYKTIEELVKEKKKNKKKKKKKKRC